MILSIDRAKLDLRERLPRFLRCLTLKKICCQYFISGQVQGVFFRRHTHEQAVLLGLKGWVRNLPDGRVEVVACGEETKVSQLRDWLWQGPPRASVSQVEEKALPWEVFESFDIR